MPCAINIDGDLAPGAPINMERLNFVKARIDEINEFNKNVYMPDVLAIGTLYKQAGWLYGGGLSATNVMDYGTYEKVNYDKTHRPVARRRGAERRLEQDPPDRSA
jgi:hydrogenase large subunit